VLTRNVAVVCATGALTVLGTGLIVSSADAAPAQPAASGGLVLTCNQVAATQVFLCTRPATVPTPAATSAPAPRPPAPRPTTLPPTTEPDQPRTAAPPTPAAR
jgi:hypothetical protein